MSVSEWKLGVCQACYGPWRMEIQFWLTFWLRKHIFRFKSNVRAPAHHSNATEMHVKLYDLNHIISCKMKMLALYLFTKFFTLCSFAKKSIHKMAVRRKTLRQNMQFWCKNCCALLFSIFLSLLHVNKTAYSGADADFQNLLSSSRTNFRLSFHRRRRRFHAKWNCIIIHFSCTNRTAFSTPSQP